MTFAYPLLQILVFLSLLLAPPDAQRVTITGPDLDVVLEHDGQNWTLARDGQSAAVSIAGGELVTRLDGREERFPLTEYVGAALRHDWTASPKLTLHDATTLEKNAAGYVLVTDAGAPAEKRYTIAFAPAVPPAATVSETTPASADAQPITIRVNVIGAVNQPQTCILPADATLLDAIAAAGGFVRWASQNQVRILRGPAGEKPTTITINARKMVETQARGPALQNGDTIMVPERVF